jgi:hypothetical protein
MFWLADFAHDADTRRLYSIMVRPCLLPVGMSTSNRIIKPGYEFYQPGNLVLDKYHLISFFTS